MSYANIFFKKIDKSNMLYIVHTLTFLEVK